VTAELQKLAQMHQSGVLSDAEFAAAKQKLLGV
jgi:Short C-terminal domain